MHEWVGIGICIWCADTPKAKGNLCDRCYTQAQAELAQQIETAEKEMMEYSPGSLGRDTQRNLVRHLRSVDPSRYVLPKHSVLKEIE